MMSKKSRSKVVDEIQYRLFLIGVGIIRISSLKVSYAIARTVGRLFYCFSPRHRNRAIRHILHSGVRTTEAEAKALAMENMIHMVKVFVEIIKFDQFVNEDNLREYIKVAPDEHSQKAFNKETSYQTIVTTAHLGNWELAGGTLSVLSGRPITSIMRPLDNEKVGNFFYAKRCSFRHKTSSKAKGLRPLLLAHRNGDNIAVVADQHASSSEGVEITFFGHPARAHATPALLYLKTGTPITFPYLIRLDDNFHFEYHCPPPLTYEPTGDKDADVKAICQKFSDMFETAIRKHPEQWLWAHRRWLDIERRGCEKYQQKNKEEEAE